MRAPGAYVQSKKRVIFRTCVRGWRLRGLRGSESLLPNAQRSSSSSTRCSGGGCYELRRAGGTRYPPIQFCVLRSVTACAYKTG